MCTREQFQTFLQESGISAHIRLVASTTDQMEPTLKYRRIDRYDFSMLSNEQTRKLLAWADNVRQAEIYLAFGQLCIGFHNRDFGSMIRLDAFVHDPHTAGDQDLDKEFVRQPAGDLTDQADKPALEFPAVVS